MKTTPQLAQDFADFCKAHPELRFWQALREFSKIPLILAGKELSDGYGVWTRNQDTFYWEELNEL